MGNNGIVTISTGAGFQPSQEKLANSFSSDQIDDFCLEAQGLALYFQVQTAEGNGSTFLCRDTVDGRNLAPPGMYKTL